MYSYGEKMNKEMTLPISVTSALQKFGQDIKDARRRRRISVALMAERAGVANTLARSEKGDSSVSMATYASILFVLGMIGKLRDLADGGNDLTGRMLEDERLPKRIRLPRTEGTNK
jgi:transcriptional regulator with XRE-family HTH domain